MRPEFGITETKEEGRRVFAMRGELDLGTVRQASHYLEADWSTREALLDLSAVTFIDTTGLRFLLNVQRDAEAKGRSLVLRNPSARVRATLRISGLLPRFRISTD